jgi:amino acid adenylation domain-containing protein
VGDYPIQLSRKLFAASQQFFVANLHSGFLHSAVARPDSPALSIGDQQWTYAELDRDARALAAALLETCNGPPERVGVLARNSKASYVGILSALFAGATFVPLNPSFPIARIRQMARNAELHALIVEQSTIHVWQNMDSSAPNLPVLLARNDGVVEPLGSGTGRSWSSASVDSVHFAAAEVPPSKAAYLLFTSGTTGTPKGVPISHRSVVHFLNACSARYNLQPHDRISQTYELTFDASIFCMFIAWWSGACVCCIDPIELVSPLAFIRRHRITWWNSVPSVATLLYMKKALTPNCMEGLKWSVFGGEALTSRLAAAWQAAAPQSTIDNLYGPTEACIACSGYRWDPVTSLDECQNKLVPIGRVFDDLLTLVVDDALAETRPGQPGELCVAGPQIFDGYWRRPDLTHERLFWKTIPGRGAYRFFRTGDRVQCLEDGTMLFLGRTDHQVQVRGHRVELGELEVFLTSQVGVDEAVAVGWPRHDGQTLCIVAFVVGTVSDTGGLLSAIRQHLPEYNVPHRIVRVDSMPRNRNGKVDRMQLCSLIDEIDGLR